MAKKISLALGLAAFLLLPGAPSRADRPPTGPELAIGYVDLQQVRQSLMQTPNWKVLERKVEDARVAAENEIEALRPIRYLTRTERQERDVLRAKQKSTEAEKARIMELEGKSDALDREFSTLAQTEKPSPEQATRIRELDMIRKGGNEFLNGEIERVSASLQEMEKECLAEMASRVELAVAKVAERRNLKVILDRQLVLFGGVDVTADVVKQVK